MRYPVPAVPVAIRYAVCVILTVLVAPFAAAQTASQLYERGREHWEATHYPQALPDLRTYRSEYQGRTAFVDYMIGTSACRAAQHKSFGFRTLDWLLYAYPLSEQGKSVVRKERDACLNTLLQSASELQLAQMVTAGVTGRGKTFHWAGGDQLGAYPVRRSRKIPREDFLARIVPIDDAEGLARAVRDARKRLDATNVVTAKGYVLASKSRRSEEELESLAGLLERFTEFHIDAFGLARPPAVITVYLTETIGELRDFASRYHGLDVSPSTIGYSFADDMSVVAVTPRNLYGTVLHELTHLLIRGNFGDAPQWLDEGVASLYEVSSDHGSAWLGESNWRANVLKEYRDLWPRLQEVIASPWFAFDDPEHTLGGLDNHTAVEQAVLTAYNRYFILYLQERGQLTAVFDAIRSRGLGEEQADLAVVGEPLSAQRHVVELVQETLEVSLDELDVSFRLWLDEVLKRGLRRSASDTARIVEQLQLP